MAVYLAASETSNEFQAKDIKHVKMPEYFSSYKHLGTESVFLGGVIVAKVSVAFFGLLVLMNFEQQLTFHSPSNYITKVRVP
jgi:hypothetical protein